MKPSYNRTRDRNLFPLQAGSFSYVYLKFGSSGLQIISTVNFSAKYRFPLSPSSVLEGLAVYDNKGIDDQYLTQAPDFHDSECSDVVLLSCDSMSPW